MGSLSGLLWLACSASSPPPAAPPPPPRDSPSAQPGDSAALSDTDHALETGSPSRPLPPEASSWSGWTSDIAPRVVEGGQQWLRLTEDEQGRLLASAESEGRLRLGWLDPEHLTVDWQLDLEGEDLLGEGIADHAQLSARGHHWLLISGHSAQQSRLLLLDEELRLQWERAVLLPEEGLPSNDPFLVEDGEGVAAGHFLPGQGHRVKRFSLDGELLQTLEIGDPDRFHCNGASASEAGPGWVVFAPESLNPEHESGIRRLRMDQDWQLCQQDEILREPGMSLGMVSAVDLGEGWWLLDLRRAPAGGDGALHRLLLSPEGIVRQETLWSQGPVWRPGLLRTGEQLWSSWDSEGQLWLQRHRLEP